MSHLTVAKMSIATDRDRRTLRGKIPPHPYAEFVNYEFGEQVLEGLELLAMSELKPPDVDGYYYCFSRSTFASE